MSRFLSLFILLLCSCAPPNTEADEARKILLNPVRLEIYLYDSDSGDECSRYLEDPDLRTQKKPDLVRHSWADFESHGFATIQIDRLPTSKKMVIFVTAIDPGTNETIGNACAQGVEVEKGALREVQLILHSASRAEAKE